MGFSVLCVLLIVFAVLWLLGELLPNAGRLGQVGRWLWVITATLMLCGARVEMG